MPQFTVIDILHTKRERKPKDRTSDEIIKIDAVNVSFDETTYEFGINEKFSTLVKPKYSDPQKLYDFFSYRLDGFSVDDLKNALGNAATLKRLCAFIGNSEVIMSDVDESAYLFACGNKYRIPFPSAMDNIVHIAQDVFGDCKGCFELMNLARYFDLNFKTSDFETRRVEIMAQVFVKLNEKLLGRDPKQQTSKDVYFTPLYKNILLRNESKYRADCFYAEQEIRILQQAKLGEAFMMLVDMLTELSRNNIRYKLNGAINMSKLAYCAEITDTNVGFPDYYSARFVNPYRSGSIKIPNLSVSIDLSPDDVSAAEKIMRDYANAYATDRTLCAISHADSMAIPNEYALAEKCGLSILDISINPSEELVRFATLKNSTTNRRDINDKKVFEYIQNNTINIFDNAETYLHTLREIKLRNNIEYVILALAVCDSGRMDALKEIAQYQKEDHPFCSYGIDGTLYYSCGVLMYQEQAIRILCELSGCSQFYADTIRKAMAKRDRKALENYKQAFLFGGEDVNGIHFCGCAGNDKIEIGKVWWTWLYETMPKLFLKAHARARAKFFLECAKLQMQSE